MIETGSCKAMYGRIRDVNLLYIPSFVQKRKSGTSRTTTGNICVMPKNLRRSLDPLNFILVKAKADKLPISVVKSTVSSVTFTLFRRKDSTLYCLNAAK